MAAISTVARLLRSGDEILADADLYGGTCRLFSRILDRTGGTVRYGDASDLPSFAAGMSPHTKLVFVETPTNPLLRVLDLSALTKLAHDNHALFCVDNSVMSPYLQNPLDLGADLVVHSATKFLCGHSDVTAGVVVVIDDALAEQIYFVQNAEGNALGPFDSYLLLRGLKTLKLRLDCQQKNALAVARFLHDHPNVARLHYPGLSNSPGYDLQQRQARGAGAVLSFTTGSIELSKRVAESTHLFHLCVSFGSVTSTISVPRSMSHASVPKEIAEVRAIPPDLVRISAGIEDIDDLLADLDEALSSRPATSEITAERLSESCPGG
jgi:cystathionine beta-lyase